MNYDEFVSYVKDSVATISGPDKKVSINHTIKTNGIELDAIVITDKNNPVSPSIYLNSYYEDYLNGEELGDIVYDIYGIYEKHKNQINIDASFFEDFEQVKPKLMFKLINYDLNKKLLRDVPHIRFLDLAIVFYCIINSDSFGSATTLIRNSQIKFWNVTTKDLLKYSKENTMTCLPCSITPMSTIVKDLFRQELETNLLHDSSLDFCIDEMVREFTDMMSRNDSVEMYVMTNSIKTNGSATILYSNVLKTFSKKVGADVYILPSSLHEVILIPYTDSLSTDSLVHMVREVNEKEVEQADILSGNVYIYNSDTDKISLAC